LVEAMGADLVIGTNTLPTPMGPRPRLNGKRLIRDHLTAIDPARRIRDFAVAFELLLHLAGEHEATSRRVMYSADPADAPLLAIFDYSAASRIVERVRSRDARFRDTIDSAVAAFRELSRPSVRHAAAGWSDLQIGGVSV